jgi:cellulose synthase/poly-beta-1,6-N-acetylglucosamine synthase-like glycosyltransferase
VESLLAVDYPRELFDVLVIADNCTDDTAARARAAGALVLERTSETERGKGYALHYAFERLPRETDAAVVIDADTLVSRNLLRAFDARLEAGALAVQADYAVRNPNAAWRTRLIAIAFGAFHIVRSRGRERLGVSAGLRGNGMCFATRLLQAVPHEAFSIVEDVEYGIRIAEAGYRVVYADDAHVYGEMVTTAAASGSQRKRWEGGRAALTRKYAPALLRRGLAGDRVLLDLAFDILVPPLSKIVVMTASGLLVSAAAAYLLGGFVASVRIFSASAAVIVIYVLRGWTLSGTGLRGLSDLAFAPVYVVWKMTLGRKSARKGDAEWVRTTREKAETAVER